MAQVICKHCKNKDEKTFMVKGIHPKGYIHKTCILIFEEEQKQKEAEKVEWSLLYDYLIDLHRALNIPPRNIKRLRELKESKNISYKLILDAYRLCEDKVNWFIKTVLNDENNADAINKVITLVINSSLNEVFRNEQLRLRREEEIRNQMNDDPKEERREIIYKKKQSVANNITAFL
ncbi:hypothetical protein [Paenibacillus medicaginis]|uniref:Recombinase zinc beta ribbon domain-containing protein n=1 Tax=Paenibacillus medicaginis TaxID=1470560 RepID=A0ABV5BVC9_9BACL